MIGSTNPVIMNVPSTAGAQVTSKSDSTGDTSLKPPVDWWQVGATRYDSTADMINAIPSGSDPIPATYSFCESNAVSTPPSKLADTFAKTAIGAAAGAAVGGGGALGLNILATIGTIFTAGAFGMPNFLPIGWAALIGGGIGAAIGLGTALFGKGDSAMPTSSIYGIVMKQATPTGEQVKFYPNQNMLKGINMNDYAKAVEPPPVGPVPPKPWYRDALVGAGYGAAGSLGSLIPLVGLIAPTGYAASLGSKATGGTLAGGVGGAAAGLAATVGTYAAINLMGWQGLLLAAGTSTLAGAALGPVVFPRVRQNEAEEAKWGDQWWRRNWDSGRAA